MKALETLLNALFVKARMAKNFVEFRKAARFSIHDFFKDIAEELFASIKIPGEE